LKELERVYFLLRTLARVSPKILAYIHNHQYEKYTLIYLKDNRGGGLENGAPAYIFPTFSKGQPEWHNLLGFMKKNIKNE
jgi:hypothetical protein